MKVLVQIEFELHPNGSDGIRVATPGQNVPKVILQGVLTRALEAVAKSGQEPKVQAFNGDANRLLGSN